MIKVCDVCGKEGPMPDEPDLIFQMGGRFYFERYEEDDLEDEGEEEGGEYGKQEWDLCDECVERVVGLRVFQGVTPTRRVKRRGQNSRPRKKK